ncbi:MAG: hypothetical protein IPJ32_04015 [Sphingobacteriaceae bacterium]|nr:hypothetical protein [Sphingobacteriaceae bacterium]
MKYKYQIVKGLILLGIAILYLNRSFHDFKEPFIKGDGIEYIMMTEAFKNHFTPDMRVKDLETFRKR